MFNWLRLLRYGEEVANPAAWKAGTISCKAIIGILTALSGIAVARGWIDAPVDAQTIAQLAPLVISVGSFVSLVLDCLTSKRAGILPAAIPEGTQAPAHGQPVDAYTEITRRNGGTDLSFGKPLPPVSGPADGAGSKGNRTNPFRDDTGA